MLSTPPAIANEISPATTPRAATETASIPEPHSRFTVAPGTLQGTPASSDAIRATLRLSSPDWFAHPNMTSSTDSQSLFSNCSRKAINGVAARSSVRTCESAPPYRPIGVPNSLTNECVGHTRWLPLSIRCASNWPRRGLAEAEHALRVSVEHALLDVVRIAEFIPLTKQARIWNTGIIAAKQNFFLQP